MLALDRFGDFLLHSLQELGVDTDRRGTYREANTALAFVTLDPHGERSFSFYRPPAADLLFRPNISASRRSRTPLRSTPAPTASPIQTLPRRRWKACVAHVAPARWSASI
jgi:hypothetical protein